MLYGLFVFLSSLWLSSATFALADELSDQKEQMNKDIDGKVTGLQKIKECVKSAGSKADLAQCQTNLKDIWADTKAAPKQHWDDTKGKQVQKVDNAKQKGKDEINRLKKAVNH